MSEVKVNKVSPRTGTELELGDSGDTIKTSGSLDTNNNNIITASNRDINLYHNGTGAVEVGGNTNPGTIILNCESNSHGIKLQSPPHSAGQSYTMKFPSGNITAGKFLKIDSVSGSGTTGVGTMTFADAGGGDMVKISTSALSSASSYSTDALNSTYFAYRIIAQITSISNQYALISGRIRNSSSDITSANYTWTVDGAFRYTNNSSGNGTLTGGYAGDTEWHCHGEGGLDTDTGEGVDMIIDLINPSNTVGYKGGFCNSRFLYDSARWYTTHSTFKYAAQAAYTGIKLYTTAGTMTGTVNLYGIK